MITSTTPVTALISTKGLSTSITAIHLDGSTDWILAAQSLLAWTGQTLTVKPTADLKLGVAYWGRSEVTGRGLLALVGRGSISEIQLKAGESYVIHPSNVIAYTINSHRPLPYRLNSSSFRLQVPNFTKRLLANTQFSRVLWNSVTWQTVSGFFFKIRTWIRRTIWGDRLFLHFYGPTTILVQTRAPRRTDSLSSSELSEVADVQPSAVQPLVELEKLRSNAESANKIAAKKDPVKAKLQTIRTASVDKDGKVSFESTGDLAPAR